MGTRKCRASAFIALLLLTRLSTSMVIERQDVNLTALPNATSIVNDLHYTADCKAAMLWHNNLPVDAAGLVTGAGLGSSNINIAFLRSSLPAEYQNSSDAALTDFYNDMSSGPLFNLEWLGTAIDDVEAVCLAPINLENTITLDRLNATQNCTATAQFLSELWGKAAFNGPQPYNASISANDSSWLDFIYYSLPQDVQNNITDVELDVYYDHISTTATSSNDTALNDFLVKAWNGCSDTLCEVQGYTGNPDIGGIGVLASYTAEAVLVTLYFIAVNAEIYIYGIYGLRPKNPSRFLKAFRRASDDLLDGALFFSLSISSAGWVSLHSGRSYYEKLVFTSANVLALSALFAFIAMFPGQYLKKRGHVLFLLIGGILVESSIQYVVYFAEKSKLKYPDYTCLWDHFNGRYHPAVFESLFFLLVGLCLVGGGLLLWYYPRHKKEIKQWRVTHEALSGVHLWAFRGRILVEIVAIAVVWTECIYLWKIRRIMGEVAGGSWSEGAWGFGQILALFVWAPPLLSITTTLMLPTWMTGQTEPDGGEVDEEENDEKKVVSPPIVSVPDKIVPVTTVSVGNVENGK